MFYRNSFLVAWFFFPLTSDLFKQKLLKQKAFPGELMIGWEELITCSTSEGHLSKPIINLQKMPCTEVIDLLIFFF